MEGLTGYVFRNAYQKNFGDVDKYFTPFITNKKMNYKEINDTAPEHNRGMHVVPQVLTNRSEDFCEIAKQLEQLGYGTVNLNLGCPSGTVAAKNRGAGFLALPEELDCFLEEIFVKCPIRISIKTRIGVEDAEEWSRLLSIYEKYPLEELIIHPRLQKEFYKGTPHREAFWEAVKCSRHILCYNGDIHSKESYEQFVQWLKGPWDGMENSSDEKRELILERLKLSEDGVENSAGCIKKVEGIMLGRGILMNPGLVGEIKAGAKMTKEKLKGFHDDVLEGYLAVMSGDRNTLFKMKELWFYLGSSFTNPDKYLKKIKKVQTVAEYKSIVSNLFYEQELK